MTGDNGKPPSYSYLCLIKTDKRGYYVRDSFYLSPVIFALAKIIKEKNPHTSLDINLINRANEDFDEFITIFDRKLEYKELKEIFNYVVNKLNLSEYVTEFNTLIKERDPLASNVSDGFLMDLEYLLSSGYGSENIEKVTKAVEKTVKNSSLIADEISPERLKEMTGPERISYAMWPGHKNLTLKEQFILSTLGKDRKKGLQFLRSITSEDEAVRIILEYMAMKTVERAAVMSRHTTPDEAFKEAKFSENTEYSTSYYIPEGPLSETSFIVMSKGEDFLEKLKDATSGILEAYGPNPYYSANGSAYLIQSFLDNRDALKWDKELWKKKGTGLKHQVFNVETDYEKARRDFRAAYDNVIRRKDEISFEHRVTFGYQDLLEKVNSFSIRKEELEESLSSSESSRDFKENELKKKKEETERHIMKMRELETEMGIARRYFTFLFRNDPQVEKYAAMEKEREKLIEETEETNRDLNVILNEYHNIQYEIKSLGEEYALKSEELEDSSKRISYYKEKYGSSFSDDEINAKLVRDEMTLPVSLWTDEEFDAQRKQLFIEALKLHRAFYNNSRCMKTDVQLFALALEGKIHESDLAKTFHELFSAAILMAPIVYINTDYAPYLLAKTGKEPTLWALIPEAGKIPLSQTMGILGRFRNILGFNVGIDEKEKPELPVLVEENLSERIMGEEDSDKFSVSLGNVLETINT